jgi:hypothetical protein
MSRPQEKVLKRALEDVEEGTEMAFEAVKDLLVSLEKPSCGGAGGWTPKVCIRIYIYTCICMYMHVCMYIYRFKYMHGNEKSYIHMIHIYTCIIYIYIYIYVYIYIHIGYGIEGDDFC